LLVQPETLLRWHRLGFRLFWKYKSRSGSPQSKISEETVALIKDMARDNQLWGAERIRGELLKLGIHVSKRTIQKYMRQVRTTRPHGQTWATFLRSHAEQIWACDFLPVTDLFFRSLFAFFIIDLHSRTVIHIGVTRSPTDSWVARTAARSHRLWRRTSSVITITRLGRTSPVLRRRVGSRFSQPRITPRERMPSVNAFSAVCVASVSISCSSSRRSSSIVCFTRMCSPSTRPGRIKGSGNGFQSSKLGQCQQITQVARSSPSQSWVVDIMITAEVPEFFQR
jgi:homeodomain-containing protein